MRTFLLSFLDSGGGGQSWSKIDSSINKNEQDQLWAHCLETAGLSSLLMNSGVVREMSVNTASIFIKQLLSVRDF